MCRVDARLTITAGSANHRISLGSGVGRSATARNSSNNRALSRRVRRRLASVWSTRPRNARTCRSCRLATAPGRCHQPRTACVWPVRSTGGVEHVWIDLGNLKRGQIVEVTLQYASNVRLMDSSNYSHYKRDGQHRYYGGYVSGSPWTHPVPRNGHWYVALDLGGHAGQVGGEARVLPGLLPAARSANPELVQIAENI